MIAVMGASGLTGRLVAHRLLDAGQPVRVVGRSASRLAGLRQRGAELAVGDIVDPGFLVDAFAGVEAAYVLVATDRHVADYAERQQREGEAIVEALGVSRVPFVVALSSLGAHLTEDTGLIRALRAQEQRLSRLEDAHLLLLRPVSFFENFLDALDGIRRHGALFDGVEPDLPLPMIGARDVAEVAARALLRRDWPALHVRELLGPRELTWREATRHIGEAIGQPDVPYVQLPGDELVAALVGDGLSVEFARAYAAMTHAFNIGLVQPEGPLASASRLPTRFEDFARELAGAHRLA